MGSGGEKVTDNRNRVAGTRVDFHYFTILFHETQLSKVRALVKFVDHNTFNFCPQRTCHADNQIVSQRSRGNVPVFYSSVDICCFENTNQNWKFPIAVNLLKVDDLILRQLGNDDPGQLHLYGHEIVYRWIVIRFGLGLP